MLVKPVTERPDEESITNAVLVQGADVINSAVGVSPGDKIYVKFRY